MRLRDWQSRFANFARVKAHQPFAWGSNDCCCFAAGAVEALTGRKPMEGVPAYTSALGAARLVKKGGGLRGWADDRLGVSVSPLMAGVGDIVLMANGGRELLAVCNGTSALAPGKNCMVALDMNAALAAWKI